MTDSIDATLLARFGFAEFRAGQRPVIAALLAGHSALAVFPTGSGKSLCYQLPALHLNGLTVVISPLIALMKDQIDFLQGRGIAAARLDSSLTLEEYRAVWRQIESGELKLLYVAPERFGSEKFTQQLQRTAIAMMVVDEAHCMSEWGHNFRPDYLKLANLAKNLRVERVLALTATATPAVAADIRRAFDIADSAYVNIGYYRPNLELRVTAVQRSERHQRLLACLRERPRGATIVYVTQQRTAEEVAAWLSQSGFSATAYHAGLDAAVRHQVQEDFMAGRDAIVVATIAFGMGIDKADIRYVYHFNMPKSMENFAQEIGRAGRDGKPSICEVLMNDCDRVVLENFTYGDTPDRESVVGLVRGLLSQGTHFDVSTYDLSNSHDMRPLVISTLLCYLELDGTLQSTGPFYSQYKIRFLVSEGELYGRFDPARQAFLRSLFALAKSGRIWLTLDIDIAVKALATERKRVVAAVNYLEEQGLIESQVSGVRQGYRLLRSNLDADALGEALHRRFVESETRDIERIRLVGRLAATSDCVVRTLLEYFGEKLGRDCGHCDRCLGLMRPLPPPELREELTPAERAEIAAWREKNHPALQTPRQLAKFFCGISSPGLSRGRPSLSRDAAFGSLSETPFQVVLQTCLPG